jgi:tetratricopeptide (TPR) repeat protein
VLKSQVILVVGACVLVTSLFLLPKVVVKNPSGLATQESLNAQKMEKSTNENHNNMEISESQKQKIATFKTNFLRATQHSEKIKWTDSLSVAFKAANQWDSAAVYLEKIAEKENSETWWLKTAETYFEAFTFALDTLKIRSLGQKSYASYEKVLNLNENNLLAQTKMGVIYKTLNPQAPMKGIQMVSAVVKKDPQNELALFYLGTFFAERGAFNDAIDRFEKVVAINPKNPDAWIYLAQCYEETQKPQKVKEALEKVLTLDVAPEIKKEIEKKIKSIR